MELVEGVETAKLLLLLGDLEIFAVFVVGHSMMMTKTTLLLLLVDGRSMKYNQLSFHGEKH
ncbi:MAG: hypothetical protein BVN35_14515 [Proteobacteria bacterium ST_bin11]|nr:MAG: hypothetical protein BVN35_14515 [Proteobacteria bacterium ST_bin11]